MKKVLGIYGNANRHWVGDGFPVRSLFSYNTLGQHISPFLLLDYAGPADFPPAQQRRGVGQHPHRGFETVTIVYQGEVEHHDSTGAGGRIGPGDVQWMTAASGILHEEYHSEHFRAKGGTLEMVQLWVNLPSRDKMNPPRYQTLLDADIPRVSLPDKAGELRVIAGHYGRHLGPAATHSPIEVWDIHLNAGKHIVLKLPKGHSCAVVVLHGTLVIGTEIIREAQVALLDREDESLMLEANNDAQLLVLSGEPLNEPIIGYGPFVMTSEEEISRAIKDFENGRFTHPG
ncbi:pirin family protein [Pseudomonas aeruginosa]|uniref:pirin family protein n=1 Tax=Pseudomonas aeruginosa TaxID=287 RepID=UPI003FD526F7